MANLIYSAITSLDGYVADESGRFDWAKPDEEVHRAANDLERTVGTYLYGRRMYEVMSYWETVLESGEHPQFIEEYARIWQAATKVVYSKTLPAPSTDKTTIEREFDPDVVREMKAAAKADISIGGPNLAAQALRAGLVDECHLFMSPVVVGGGNSAMPVGIRFRLELLEERTFGNGVIHLHYRLMG